MYAFTSVVAVRMKKTSMQTTKNETKRNAGPILASAAPVLTNSPVPRRHRDVNYSKHSFSQGNTTDGRPGLPGLPT